MKKLYLMICVLLLNCNFIYAFTWEDCVERYEKVRQFSDNIRLSYLYLKSTKSCLVKFKTILLQNPNPDFTVKAMNENIKMIDRNIKNLLPKYIHPKNNLQSIPKYININSNNPLLNEKYAYIRKFKNCNGIHAHNRIYTAKHCNIKNSKNLHYDLDFIETTNKSNLKIARLDLNKTGIFKYYSMSKVGRFYSTLLQEKNCKFYEAKNETAGLNLTLDLTDLTKKVEIRSTCLAIPSNSGGGVFQDGKLVAIISKTVFSGNKFLYSIVEPIIPRNEIIASN